MPPVITAPERTQSSGAMVAGRRWWTSKVSAKERSPSPRMSGRPSATFRDLLTVAETTLLSSTC